MKQIKSEDKIFKEWAKKKLAAYTEPERKGVTKGESIGVSQYKYRCAVYMILSKYENTKSASEIIEKSVALISKWKHEEHFNNLRNQLSREFSEHVVNIITGKPYENEVQTLDVMKCFSLYNKVIRDRLVRALEGKIKKIERDKSQIDLAEYCESSIYYSVLKWFFSTRNKLHRPEDDSAFKLIFNNQINMLDEIKNTLQTEYMSKLKSRTNHSADALEKIMTSLFIYKF